jgi:transcriptional regulator with XRE-family HTH domain
MGFDNRSHLSRVERGQRIPRLEQALRYEFLFGVPIEKMVPGLCTKVLNGLWEDIQSQLNVCDISAGPKAERKCEILRAAKERIESMSS